MRGLKELRDPYSVRGLKLSLQYLDRPCPLCPLSKTETPQCAMMKNHLSSNNNNSNEEEGCPPKALIEEGDDAAPKKANKKKKKKKKMKTGSDADPTVPVDGIGCRPGKKKLRKLRYQQQHLSPIEFLLNSVEACKFTGSVSTSWQTTTSAGDKDESQLSPVNTLPVGSQVQVVTSCHVTPTTNAVVNQSSNSIISQSTLAQRIIRVQPLLVLDLNGILCHRFRPHRALPNVPRTAYREPVAQIAGTPIIARTDLVEFLTFLDQHFCLAVWTSAKNKTATALVKALIPSDIANRFLFVWAQHHCDTIIVPPARDANDDKNTTDPIYEKNLTKVWNEYPVWNAHTTILMDDSPDKCQKWHANAVHPPALHGIQASHVTSKLDGMLSDEENARLQRAFFQGLVQRFQDCSVVTEWSVTETASAAAGDTTATLDAGADKAPFRVSSPPILLDHLRETAVGHMGWTR